MNSRWQLQAVAAAAAAVALKAAAVLIAKAVNKVQKCTFFLY